MQRPQRHDPYAVPPFVEYLQQQQFPYRILGLDSYLYPNINGVFDIDDVRYVDALFPVTYAKYIRSLIYEPDHQAGFEGTEEVIYFGRGLDLLNVEYVVTAANETLTGTRIALNDRQNFVPVYQDQMVTIYRNQNAFPRAFVVQQAESVLNTEEALQRLRDPAFDSAQTVLIENLAIAERTTPVSSRTLQQATVTARTNNDLAVNVTLDQAGWLVVSEQAYPGWEAFVDGNPTQIFTANAVMRAVYLEAGMHQVEFRFHPTSFRLGLMVAAITLLMLSGFYLLSWFQKRLRNSDYAPTIPSPIQQ
jgi:uncharacterized membrane protein YfhO